MKTVWVIRAMPEGADARVQRWCELYSASHTRLITWGGASKSTSGFVVPYRPVTGNRWMPLAYLWFVFAVFWLAAFNFRRGDRLVCVDLEALLGAWLPARLWGVDIHFDVADPFYLAKPVPCGHFWRWLEAVCINHVEWATAPHASRFALYGKLLSRPNRHVVENVPMLVGQSPLPIDEHQSAYLRLGYFGGLERHRGLEDLISLVRSNTKLTLKIGGRGALAALAASAAQNCSRITYVGSFEAAQLPELMLDVDVYCALYYGSKPLHQYACPNKYYESLALAKPILVSRLVPQSVDVARDETGWVIDEDGIEAIFSTLSMLSIESVVLRAFSAACVWRERYSDYYEKLASAPSMSWLLREFEDV